MFLSLVVLGCAAPAAPAAYSGEAGRIAFQGDSGAARGIFTMNSDGSDVVAVTDVSVAGANNIQPAWSPDGLRIGFFRPSTQRIVIVNPDGTSPQTVPVAARSGPAWSPDALKVGLRQGQRLPDIFSVNLNGTGLTKSDWQRPRLRLDANGGWHASWSPIVTGSPTSATGMVDDLDGGEQPGSIGLRIMDTDGVITLWPSVPYNPLARLCRLVARRPQAGVLRSVRIDPYNDPTDIYVINADGSVLVNLTDSPQKDTQPAWSPGRHRRSRSHRFLGPPAEAKPSAPPASAGSATGRSTPIERGRVRSDPAHQQHDP